MIAIAANALYTNLYRRGTTRQLASVIVTCVIAALLLLPAIVWYNLRFSAAGAALSIAEIQVMLVYIALCGWVLPLGATACYCLFTLPHLSTTSVEEPPQKTRARPHTTTLRHQSGVLTPFVFSEDTPWGWLEHHNGRFQGQRLALTRAIITLGRDEDTDIWLDDDMASRQHAELAWDKGQVYLTDCKSLNGVSLNGRRIYGSALIKQGDLVEIGTHRFVFFPAEPPVASDPLANYVWQSSLDSLPPDSTSLPATKAPTDAAKSARDEQKMFPLAPPPPTTPLPFPHSSDSSSPLRLPSKPKINGQ